MRIRRGNGRRRSIAARLLAATLVGVVGVPTVLWLTFQHKPGWYRPVVLDDQAGQAAKADAVAVADYVSDRMVEGRPFEVTLSDRAVNAWLATLPTAWPDARDVLPPDLTDPAVRFDRHGLRVGLRYTANGWQAILGVRLVIGLSRDGAEITMTLTGASGGSLPVPRVLLDRVIERLLPTLREGGNRADTGGGSDVLTDPLRAAFQSVRSAADLFEGIAIPNRFVWFNGDRPFRIRSVAFVDGEVRLGIEPL